MTERIRRPKFEEEAQSSIWNLFSPPRPLGASDMPDAIEAKIRATLGRFSVAKPFLGGNVLGISREEFQSQPDNYLTVPSEKAEVTLIRTTTYMDLVPLEEKNRQPNYGHKPKTLPEPKLCYENIKPPNIQKITEVEPKPPIPNGFDFLESLLQTPNAERQYAKAVDILKDDLNLSDTSSDSDEAPNETRGSKDSLKWLLDLSLSEEETEVSNRPIKGSAQEQNSKFHNDKLTAATNRCPPELFKNPSPIGLAKTQGIAKADLELSDISDNSDAFDTEANASKDSLKWLQDLSLSEDEDGVDQKPKGRNAQQEMGKLGNGMLSSSSSKENSNSVRYSRKIETSLEVLRKTIVPKLCQRPLSPIKPEAPCTNQDIKARLPENDAKRTSSSKISKSEPAPRDVRTSGSLKSVPSINGVRRASSPQRIRKPEPAKGTASANDMKRDAETARKTSNQCSLSEPSKKHASLEHSLTAAPNGTKNTLLKKTEISKPVPPETSVIPTKPKLSYESSSTQSAARPTAINRISEKQESREISVKQKLIAENFSSLSKAPLLIRPAKEMPHRNSLPTLPKIRPAEPKQMPLSNCQRRPLPTRRTVLNKNISKREDDPLLNLFCRKGTIDQIRLSKKRKLSEESNGATERTEPATTVKPQELKFAPCRPSTTSSSDEEKNPKHQTTASSCSERENTSDYESSAKRTSSERSFPIEKEKVSEYKQNYNSKLETLPEGKVLEMKSKSISSRESSKSKCLTSDYESSSQGTSSEESEPRSKKIKIDDRQETILKVEEPKSDALSSNTFAEALQVQDCELKLPRKGENKSKDDTHKRKHKKHRSKERRRSRERAKKEQEDNRTPEHREEHIRKYDANYEHQKKIIENGNEPNKENHQKKSEKSKHKDKKREREHKSSKKHHKSKAREKQPHEEDNEKLIIPKPNSNIRTLQSEEKEDKLPNQTRCEEGVTNSKRISLTDYLKRSEKAKAEEPSLLRPIDQKNKIIEENRENCKINEDHLRKEHQRVAVTKEHSKRKDSLSSTSSGSSSTKSGENRDHKEKEKHDEKFGREKHRERTVKDNQVHRTDQQKHENRKRADSFSSTSSQGIPIRERRACYSGEKQKIKDSSSSSSNFTNEDKVNVAVLSEDIRHQKTNYQEQVQREHWKRENSLSSISSGSMSECEDPVDSTAQKRDAKKEESLADVSISKPGEKQTIQDDNRHRADPQKQLSQGIRKHEDSGRKGVHGNWSRSHDDISRQKTSPEEQLLKENRNRTESLSSTSSGSSTSAREKEKHKTSTSSMDSRSKYHVKHQEPLLQRKKPEDFIASAFPISTAVSREKAKYFEEKPTSEGKQTRESANSMSSNLQEPIRIKVGEREDSLSSSGTTPHRCRVMEPIGDKLLLKAAKDKHHCRANEEKYERERTASREESHASEKMKIQQDHRNYQHEPVLVAARKPAEYLSSTAKCDEEEQEERGSWPSTSSRTTSEYGNGHCFAGKQEKEVLKRDQGIGNHNGVEALEINLQSVDRPPYPTAILHQKPTEPPRDEEKESSRHKRSKEKKKKKHKDRGRSRSREKKRSSKKKKRNRSQGEESRTRGEPNSTTPTISENFQDDAGHLNNKQESIEEVDSPQPTMKQPVSIKCSLPLSRLQHVNPAWFRQSQGATDIETTVIEEDQHYSKPIPAEDLHYTESITMEQRHYARDIATKEFQYTDPTILEAQHSSEQRGLLSLRPDPRENELACNILSSLMNF